jgi:hypothetical protein
MRSPVGQHDRTSLRPIPFKGWAESIEDALRRRQLRRIGGRDAAIEYPEDRCIHRMPPRTA